MANAEAAEAADLDRLAGLKRLDHSSQRRVDNFLGSALGDASSGGDGLDQVRFRHGRRVAVRSPEDTFGDLPLVKLYHFGLWDLCALQISSTSFTAQPDSAEVYCPATLDQADVSPDSKPSSKTRPAPAGDAKT